MEKEFILEKASRHHIENSADVLSECLGNAKISVKDLDLVSYAAGPGLGPCLRVGAVVARSLASFYKIPIFPVNHAIGHIELGKLLTGATNPLGIASIWRTYYASSIS